MSERPIEVVTTDGMVMVYPNGIVKVYEYVINDARFRASNLATIHPTPAQRRALARALDPEHYAAAVERVAPAVEAALREAARRYVNDDLNRLARDLDAALDGGDVGDPCRPRGRARRGRW